ncbi:ice-binding family protein [Candidatus Contubernalis alkaliaceticus]|uniref:ice-binding family protein n=1 Tax=Candidatus Contubernalis alkaliaceticus TaxID=338645 RepID=UPI001F4C3CE2|nr:ice-binding family protein [Candidatus Contubernalis alkalaceticus]UNC91197.1 DUF3494 domain-containing protein [Candidatus Contubernalis alkalaceticus]
MKRIQKAQFIPLLLLLLLVVTLVVPTMPSVGIAAQQKVNLGTAESFAILAASAITVAGEVETTTIYGDIGVYPSAAYTGEENVVQTGGGVYRANEVAQKAQDDLSTAYTDAETREGATEIPTQLGGQELTPGVYDSADGTFELTGTLTLYADNPNDAFIFQMESTLTTASASSIVLTGEATVCQVYWQVGSSATLGTNSTFVGHILALQDITATTGVEVEGQLLAMRAVTLDTNTITVVGCTPPDDPDDDAPAISVKKYVSVDGGDTWHDAQSAPGPSVEVGSEVLFKFVVTNTGNVTLTDITLSDDVYGHLSDAALTDPLPVGGDFEYILEETAKEGQHQNTATATGDHEGVTYSDTDAAHYWGYVSDAPAISVKKYVSVDGGDTWHDAQSAPGPSVEVGSEVFFKFVVTNTGNVTLTDITLSDDVYGHLSGAALTDPLPVGGDFKYILEETAKEGQHQNTATATGDHEGVTYSDTDAAHYWGYVSDAPAISVKKYVSVDGGDTWHDAQSAPGPSVEVGSEVLFKFVVTNTGNVTLTDITLSDNVYGHLSGAALTDPLPVGGDFKYILEETAKEGQHQNTATATGDHEGVTYGDTDAAHYWGYVSDAPAISVKKYVSVDGGDTWHDAQSAPGPSVEVGSEVLFKFVVTNTGNVTLTDITLSDNVYDLSGAALTDPLPVGGDFKYILEETAEEGQHQNTATATGDHEGVTYSDTDAAHYWGYVSDAPATGSLTVTKVVSGDTGDMTLPSFEITVTWPEGFLATRTFVDGKSFTWENLVPGVYTVTENQDGLSSEWTVSGEGTVQVTADQTAMTTITNGYEKEIVKDINHEAKLPKTGGNALLTTYWGLILFGTGLLMRRKRK